MRWLLEPWHAVGDFVEAGGDVLLVILVVTFLMWVLIVERYWYLTWSHPHVVRRVCDLWEKRRERKSWYAHRIREAMVSSVSLELDRGIGSIKTLVALCPLLGLLGTVTGMIEVFDVMSISGGGNTRAMASGVQHATVPTMAGMVAALSGLIFSVQLERRARSERERVADLLSPEH